ncbi:MAG: tRNA (uridine(34)/cytosine(34)/5-carboxymethylaminomethyluridine(34)-2'-O)-methyltransferase TrmL [Megasphaera sp.]|jgi:tRNA (cytidine/uridine-2'-O-)-methyltransferase|nr:tRNA (uridine(34)/cytosine(34)/5-carboxymethylaminomethyluridine(34)-2'-O)-methyltransferase TrmL [Megasphaera sp.]MCH4187559.1 tRNA (uridine(34)/cytosine(34)/5-carboxymethylaminomethyluridine(34)-2'-O)-methyltransferase TrmL [Megasphaera sp.]MCH4217896.1 tRNA (uridine(34)/cytosine(34)/5-carboxymethylaminomethyluridine(34)-2'-O)-methyltransferase TrmL [Megasphaera sp.]
MHIVMVEPEIPGNTGNIARLCAANHITLHLVKPLGFLLDDKHLKRAGLDYWSLVDVVVHENFEEVQEKYKGHRFFYLTTKAEQCYADIQFQQDDLLVFGKETKGLPESLLKQYPESCFRIPMADKARSLNLSNSVAIVSYEALRQLGFPDMARSGIGIKNLK